MNKRVLAISQWLVASLKYSGKKLKYGYLGYFATGDLQCTLHYFLWNVWVLLNVNILRSAEESEFYVVYQLPRQI